MKCGVMWSRESGIGCSTIFMACGIRFDQLPDSFVLKVTHGSGQNLICRDKSQLDVERTRRLLAQWMKRSEYWVTREWAY